MLKYEYYASNLNLLEAPMNKKLLCLLCTLVIASFAQAESKAVIVENGDSTITVDAQQPADVVVENENGKIMIDSDAAKMPADTMMKDAQKKAMIKPGTGSEVKMGAEGTTVKGADGSTVKMGKDGSIAITK